MAIYVTGARDYPSKNARIAAAAGRGLQDVTQVLFTLQQLQDKRAQEAQAAKDKQLSLAVPLMQLQANQAHWAQLEQRHADERAADAAKEQERRAYEGQTGMDKLRLEYQLKANLDKAKSEIDAAKPEKPIVDKPTELQKLTEDFNRVKRGLSAKHYKGASVEQLGSLIENRTRKEPQPTGLAAVVQAANPDAAPAQAQSPWTVTPSGPTPTPTTLSPAGEEYLRGIVPRR